VVPAPVLLLARLPWEVALERRASGETQVGQQEVEWLNVPCRQQQRAPSEERTIASELAAAESLSCHSKQSDGSHGLQLMVAAARPFEHPAAISDELAMVGEHQFEQHSASSVLMAAAVAVAAAVTQHQLDQRSASSVLLAVAGVLASHRPAKEESLAAPDSPRSGRLLSG
jgi:hypothetical protein